MNFRLLILALILAIAPALSVMAKEPPRIAVLPDKGWCAANGYTTQNELDGKLSISPNYAKALADANFSKVAAHISALFSEAGLPVVSNEDALSADGKSDVIMSTGWTVTPRGAGYSCEYRIEAIDTASGKVIAAIAGTQDAPSRMSPQYQFVNMAISAEFPVLANKLQNYFMNQMQPTGPSK